MEEVIQRGTDRWLTKYRLYAFAAIACPILAYVWRYFERLHYYADYLRSINPDFSEEEIMALAATRVEDHFGSLIFAVGMASIIGLGLAAISFYLTRRLTIVGLLAFVVNGVPFLFFIYLLLAYQALKASVIHN